MLAAIAMTPSAPVLVPGLAGAAESEVDQVREAALRAAADLPARWIVVGTGSADQVIGPDARGSYGGYGVDVAVTLSPNAPETPEELPLCALWAGWLRGRVNPDGHVQVRVMRSDTPAAEAVRRGRLLRAEIDRIGEPVGVLVVADGANTLTQAAPGGHDPAAAQAQAALDDALAAGEPAAVAELAAGSVGRVAYQVLAGLAGPSPCPARELARAAPFGVGYFVGVWTPGAAAP